MNVFNIERAFAQKKSRNWDKLFVCVDLHDCIIKGTYTLNNEGRELYPHAQEVLQWFSRRPDVVLILWTSSYKRPIREIVEWLRANRIVFQFVNENPLCPDTQLCSFRQKFYFNILLDDKAGFDGETDWLLIKEELIRIGEWEQSDEGESADTFFGGRFKRAIKRIRATFS